MEWSQVLDRAADAIGLVGRHHPDASLADCLSGNDVVAASAGDQADVDVGTELAALELLQIEDEPAELFDCAHACLGRQSRVAGTAVNRDLVARKASTGRLQLAF